MLPEAYRCKTEIEIDRQWARLTDDGSTRFDQINEQSGGVDGATRYVTKFSHVTDLDVLMHLPGGKRTLLGGRLEDYQNQ